MKRICDLYGNFSDSFGEYHYDNRLFGRVNLNDDNTFEGTIQNIATEEKYFTFGKCSKEKIEFIIGNLTDTEEIPKKFSLDKDGTSYYGTMFATDIGIEIPLGESNFYILPAELIREVTYEEQRYVERETKNAKDSLEGRISKLYEEFIKKNNQNNQKTEQK